jgi:hypothetical protein
VVALSRNLRRRPSLRTNVVNGFLMRRPIELTPAVAAPHQLLISTFTRPGQLGPNESKKPHGDHYQRRPKGFFAVIAILERSHGTAAGGPRIMTIDIVQESSAIAGCVHAAILRSISELIFALSP